MECRQNYVQQCEAGVNKQINMELYASYVYMSMAYYFQRSDVALQGFHKFFLKQSNDEREHAKKDIKAPEKCEWKTGLEAMTEALNLEKKVNQSLLELHEIAERNGDAQFSDFIETEYLEEQVRSIKELSDYVRNLERVGPGLGEYMFDKETLQD